MCTGDNRKSVACWLTENEYLLQLLIFVRNKIHNTYQMEMKSLCWYWSSYHTVTDCTLETTLTFKSIVASDIYLSCLT